LSKSTSFVLVTIQKVKHKILELEKPGNEPKPAKQSVPKAGWTDL